MEYVLNIYVDIMVTSVKLWGWPEYSQNYAYISQRSDHHTD